VTCSSLDEQAAAPGAHEHVEAGPSSKKQHAWAFESSHEETVAPAPARPPTAQLQDDPSFTHRHGA
jgi:hypothetical protein